MEPTDQAMDHGERSHCKKLSKNSQTSRECPSGKVLNPKTGRCINVNTKKTTKTTKTTKINKERNKKANTTQQKTNKAGEKSLFTKHGKYIPITDEDMHVAWGRDLLYRGNDVIDLLVSYERDFMKYAGKVLDLSDFDGQESYLGYLKSSDRFIVGFDGSFHNNHSEIDVVSVMVVFKVDDGGNVKILDADFEQGKIFYEDRSTYDQIKKRYGDDLVDLRLD